MHRLYSVVATVIVCLTLVVPTQAQTKNFVKIVEGSLYDGIKTTGDIWAALAEADGKAVHFQASAPGAKGKLVLEFAGAYGPDGTFFNIGMPPSFTATSSSCTARIIKGEGEESWELAPKGVVRVQIQSLESRGQWKSHGFVDLGGVSGLKIPVDAANKKVRLIFTAKAGFEELWAVSMDSFVLIN